MRIAIIGTAGRKEDSNKLSKELYEKMRKDACGQVARYSLECACIGHDPFIPLEDGIHLVSGGAAWSDHIVISNYLEDLADSLTLYFPCKWHDGLHRSGFDELNQTAGRTANYYHKLFSDKMGHNTLEEIQRAIDKGAIYHEVIGGFKARNLSVGKVDMIIAYTFGEGDVPKDGGTKHTWDHSTAPIKIHRPIGEL